MTWVGPKPRFMSGALLGNGGLGAVVTTRPDAIVISFGHNSVWDVRIDESQAQHLGTFRELFERLSAIDPHLPRLEEDDWYRDYRRRTEHSYTDTPYPRPYPCGSVVLGLSRRDTEVLGHSLSIVDGVCTVELAHAGGAVFVRLFVDQDIDRLWIETVNSAGAVVPSPFTRVRLVPDPDGPAPEPSSATTGDEEGAFEDVGEPTLRPGVTPWQHGRRQFGFTERLPRLASGGGEAMEFCLAFDAPGELEPTSRLDWFGNSAAGLELERTVDDTVGFIASVTLTYSRIGGCEPPEPLEDVVQQFGIATESSRKTWLDYWNRSSIALSDSKLEQIWYRNTYFMQCVTRAGKTCPGLFGNWSYRSIGTMWHGDYHLNYNTQQAFWGAFSSNRVENHEPYVSLIEDLLPLGRSWASSYYELGGANFPHSAYPVPMTIMPWASPPWGWEICETPWAVQSLWWEYEYTLDETFLRDRAFTPLKEAVRFLVDYISRPECRGESWGDDRWHIYPTVVPELYGLRPGFRFNADCIADLALTRFAIRAFHEACEVLGCGGSERELLKAAAEVYDHLPDYPTAETGDGPVFVSTPGEHPDVVYNVPVSAMPIFPGEQVTSDSEPRLRDIAERTVARLRTEGGNDLVFKNLQAARLGVLDLARFKRDIAYCELENGTCTDLAAEVHGRYNDATPFDYMSEAGVWVENFALPAVVNECLMQSHESAIRVFPNCEGIADAQFDRLRAKNAFLVSAARSAGDTQWIRVDSEAGASLRIEIPWPNGAWLITMEERMEVPTGVFECSTREGDTYRFIPRTA